MPDYVGVYPHVLLAPAALDERVQGCSQEVKQSTAVLGRIPHVSYRITRPIFSTLLHPLPLDGEQAPARKGACWPHRPFRLATNTFAQRRNGQFGAWRHQAA